MLLRQESRISISSRGRGKGRLCINVGCLGRISECWWTYGACCAWETTNLRKDLQRELIRFYPKHWGSCFGCGLSSDLSMKWDPERMRMKAHLQQGSWLYSRPPTQLRLVEKEGFQWTREDPDGAPSSYRSPCILLNLSKVHGSWWPWSSSGPFQLRRNAELWRRSKIPEIFCKIFFDVFHVSENANSPRMFVCIVRSIIFDSFIDEVELFLHSWL